MALHWSAKPEGATYRYAWTPALAEGDGLAGYTVSASGADIDAQAQNGDEVVLYVSGGTAGTAAVFTFEATSTQGETLTETVYLPIRATALAFGDTARDVCYYALRKVSGIGVDPEAAEMDDALERLNGMLAAWKDQGADVGAMFPIAAGDTLKVSDAFLQAIRANLILRVADLYDYQPSAMVVEDARRGLQQIKMALLSQVRTAVFY